MATPEFRPLYPEDFPERKDRRTALEELGWRSGGQVGDKFAHEPLARHGGLFFWRQPIEWPTYDYFTLPEPTNASLQALPLEEQKAYLEGCGWIWVETLVTVEDIGITLNPPTIPAVEMFDLTNDQLATGGDIRTHRLTFAPPHPELTRSLVIKTAEGNYAVYIPKN